MSQYEPRHDKTNKTSVRPAKTQISLSIRPVWSESSLCAQWVAKDPRFLHADSEDSDQTGRMPRLIWVLAAHTLTLLVLLCRGSYQVWSCSALVVYTVLPYKPKVNGLISLAPDQWLASKFLIRCQCLILHYSSLSDGTTVMFLSFRTDRSNPRGAVWSGSTLFAIPSASFGLITLW